MEAMLIGKPDGWGGAERREGEGGREGWRERRREGVRDGRGKGASEGEL